MQRKLPSYLARVRLPLTFIGLLLAVTDNWHDVGLLALTGSVLFLAGFASLFLPFGYVRSTTASTTARKRHPGARDPIEVVPPVHGRWVPVNSPADRVPSHGIHAYGQTHAIDLVREPADGDWTVPWWPLGRRPEMFTAFGEPIFAPADGVVVRTHDRERDHLSRNSWPGLLYLLIEGFLRELTGPSRILGNHVILDLGNGVYAALAHLRRGSVRVTKGQRVTAGEQLAECGNSGNSSEPHLHFQLMDHRNVLIAAGLPFVFERYEADDGEVRCGVPGGRRVFAASAVRSDASEGTAPQPGR